MTPENIPHLCGGILFDLLLEARKPRRKARNKLNGGSDGLTAPGVYAGLIHIVTGEDISTYAGTTLEKCASDYKKCLSSTGTYVPFTDSATQSSFDAAYKRKDPDLLERTSGFIDNYLNNSKCEWLVRALIETMQSESHLQDVEIDITYDTALKVSELHTAQIIIFLPFFLSVLHFVMVNCPDCESGRPTFETWYSQASPKAEWKFNSKIGEGIQPLNVSADLSVPTSPVTQEIPVEHEDVDISELSDHEVITNAMTNTVKIMADVLGRAEHQLAEQIRQNQKKNAASSEETASDETTEADTDQKGKGTVIHQTIVNQYGDHPVHIDHVDNLKL